LWLNVLTSILNKTQINVCLTDYNSIKSHYENFEYDMKLTKVNEFNYMNEMNVAEEVCYDLADFSFETDGSINVAFTNYDLQTPIYIYKVIFTSSASIFLNNIN
jgi:hypothetical protein